VSRFSIILSGNKSINLFNIKRQIILSIAKCRAESYSFDDY